MSQTLKFTIFLASFVVFSVNNSVFAERNTWKTAAIAVRCADNQWHLMDVTSEIDGHAEAAPALVGNLKEVSERVREWAPSWTDAIKASAAILMNPGSFELPSYDTTNSPSAPTGCEARYLARYVIGSKTIVFDRSLLNALPPNEQTLAKLRAQLSVVLDEDLTQDTLLVFRSLFQRKLDPKNVDRWWETHLLRLNLETTWAGFRVVPRGEYLAIETRTEGYQYYAPIFIDSHWVTGKKRIDCDEMSAFSLTTEKILKTCKLEFVSDGILGSNQNQKFLGLDERAFSGPFYLLHNGWETTIDFRRHMEQRGTYPTALIETPWFDPTPLPIVKVVLSKDRVVSDFTFLMKPGQISIRVVKTPIEIESESNLVISLARYGMGVKAAEPAIAQYHLKIFGNDLLVSGDSWAQQQNDKISLSFAYANSLSELAKSSILESTAKGCKIDAVADLLSSNLILKKASCTGSFTLKTSLSYSGTGSWDYGRDMWNGKVTREWWNLQEADGTIQSSMKFISLPGVFEASNYSLSPEKVSSNDSDNGKMSGSAKIFGKPIAGDKISWSYWHAEHGMYLYIDYDLEAGRLPTGIEQVGTLHYAQKGAELPTLSALGRAKKGALLPCANGRTMKTEEGKEYELTWYPSVAKFQIPAEACL